MLGKRSVAKSQESGLDLDICTIHIYIYIYILLVLARTLSFFLGSSWLDVAIYKESFARPVK